MPHLHLGRGDKKILTIRHERRGEAGLLGMLCLPLRLLQFLQIETDLTTVDLHVSIQANYK